MRHQVKQSQEKHERAWKYYTSGKLEEAKRLYVAISRKYPHDDKAWTMLGIIEGQMGDYVHAEEHLRQALLLNNSNFDAYVNHGLALFSMGFAGRSIPSYLRALEIKPDHVKVLLLLGNAYAKLDQLVPAENTYMRLLQVDPSNAVAYGNLANTLAYQGRQAVALGYYGRALQLDPKQTNVHSNMLLSLHYDETLTPEGVFEEHLKWASRHCSRIGGYTDYLITAEPNRKLRIGYVTPDLRGHSVAYFIESLLREHSSEHFEIFCYVEMSHEDSMTRRLWESIDVLRNTSRMADAEVAQMIYDDGIDILIDLAGHTENNRLPVFAYKPAPVQLTYLGYPDTTGLETIDYRISDAIADPPGMTEHLHSETLIRLENGFLCFVPPDESPVVGPLPALERGYITFGSFNVLTKITPAMLDVWADILRRLPDARLLIKNRQLTDPAMNDYLRAELVRREISSDRLTLLGTTSKMQHMATYREVDIALDSYPYAGTTTTCDTLWMGIPVVTMAGSTHVSRVGASLLARVGLDELVCGDAGHYVMQAVMLGRDVNRLAHIRAELRNRMQCSALCNPRVFVGEFEEMLRCVWYRWCKSKLPANSAG